jgi:hypothetical protein
MRSSELLRQLHEANKKLQAKLDLAERQRLKGIETIAANYAELRWLEKDYDDERDGDWTR